MQPWFSPMFARLEFPYAIQEQSSQLTTQNKGYDQDPIRIAWHTTIARQFATNDFIKSNIKGASHIKIEITT